MVFLWELHQMVSMDFAARYEAGVPRESMDLVFRLRLRLKRTQDASARRSLRPLLLAQHDTSNASLIRKVESSLTARRTSESTPTSAGSLMAIVRPE